MKKLIIMLVMLSSAISAEKTYTPGELLEIGRNAGRCHAYYGQISTVMRDKDQLTSSAINFVAVSWNTYFQKLSQQDPNSVCPEYIRIYTDVLYPNGVMEGKIK